MITPKFELSGKSALSAAFDSAATRIATHMSLASLPEDVHARLTEQIFALKEAFLSEYEGRQTPSGDAILYWFGVKLAGTPAEETVRQLLSGERAAPSFQLTQPALLTRVPERESAPQEEAQPRQSGASRRTGPSISEIREKGYTEMHSEGYYGISILFASNAEGQTRTFQLNARGQITRELTDTQQVQAIRELSTAFRSLLAEIESSIPGYSSMDFDTRARVNEEIERIANRLFSRYAGRSAPSRPELLQQFRSAARGEELLAGLGAL